MNGNTRLTTGSSAPSFSRRISGCRKVIAQATHLGILAVYQKECARTSSQERCSPRELEHPSTVARCRLQRVCRSLRQCIRGRAGREVRARWGRAPQLAR